MRRCAVVHVQGSACALLVTVRLRELPGCDACGAAALGRFLLCLFKTAGDCAMDFDLAGAACVLCSVQVALCSAGMNYFLIGVQVVNEG